jgi:hypothetical protein
MAQTVRALFPNIPPQAITVLPTKASFTAPLVAGKFSFDQTVSIGLLNDKTTAIIAGVEFSANIDQLDFNDALDSSVQGGFFRLDLLAGGNGHQVNLQPFLFSAFGQGGGFMTEYAATAATDQQEEMFLRLRGSILQTPRILTLAKSAIVIQVTLNQYNIMGGYNV